MLASKSTVFAVLILVCNLHSIDAATCRIPDPGRIPALGGTGGDVYSLLSAANQACTAACTTCGQAACTAARAANAVAGIISTTAGVNGCPTMRQLGFEICPTITFNNDADSPAADGESFFQSVTGMTFATHQTTGIDFAAAYQSTPQFSNVANTPERLLVGQAGLLTYANANSLTVCPCIGPVTTTCPICGCNDFGMPTSAPTGIPTMAPTAASSTTDLGQTFSASRSDDSLSGGAIAGIVIGSVVGAALVIGAGVMIGSTK